MRATNYIEWVARDILRETGEDTTFMVEDAPLWLGYAVLCLAKGEDTTSEDVHNAWSAWQTMVSNTHPSLIPFNDLEPHTRAYDDIYRDAIHAVAKRRALAEVI